MTLSKHAERRIQKRGIPPLVLEWLQQYGSEVRTHGTSKLYFDRAARRRLGRDVGHQVVDRLGSLLDTYIVVADGTVVTAAHRLQRIRRG